MDSVGIPTFTEFVNSLGKSMGKKLTLVGVVFPDGTTKDYAPEPPEKGNDHGRNNARIEGDGSVPHVQGQSEEVSGEIPA